MARMYSRSKGKAGSTKPSKFTKPSWLTYDEKELKLIIVKLAKENNTAAQIGSILRDSYGIPDVKKILGVSIEAILRENHLYPEIPEDLYALLKNALYIRKHLDDNHHDMTAKRGLNLTESKIRRLRRYYIKVHKLPADWKYDPDKLKIIIS
ncbi:MAG: 30S ribosomal protein S15 [Nitrospiraceae bacterium]|nr:30S ribosomal protein S15 [Nitrospiraceae bacterium]